MIVGRAKERSERRTDGQAEDHSAVWRKLCIRKSSDEITRIVSNELVREKGLCLLSSTSHRFLVEQFIDSLDDASVSILRIPQYHHQQQQQPTLLYY